MAIRINDSLREEIRIGKSKERKKGSGRIENAEGKIGGCRLLGLSLGVVRLFGPAGRPDRWPRRPRRSGEPLPLLLAEPWLRADGSQPVRPGPLRVSRNEGAEG